MKRWFPAEKVFYTNVFKLALPIILQLTITVGVNATGTFMLGCYGEAQISGASLANAFINIYQILCMGMGSGAAVLTAQYWGKKDMIPLKKTVIILLRVCVATALVFTLITGFLPRKIMSIYTTDSEIIEQGAAYLRINAATFLPMGITLALTLVMRSIRKVKVTLCASILCLIINIFLNWVFIYGNLGAQEMRIEGAALGMVISRLVEVSIIIVYAFWGEKDIKLRITDIFCSCRSQAAKYIQYAVPVMISDLLLGIGNSAVSVVIGHIGTEFVAANAIIATVNRLANVSNQGLGSAAAIIIGNTLGKNDRKRAEREATFFFLFSFIFGIVISILILLLTPGIISLYNITEQTRENAIQMMYGISVMSIFMTTQFVLTKGILRGGGDTRFVMVADILFLWILSIPLGVLCGFVWYTSPFWIFIALKIDWVVKSVWCSFRLIRKKWIHIVAKTI